jgi:hypothetical protein
MEKKFQHKGYIVFMGGMLLFLTAGCVTSKPPSNMTGKDHKRQVLKDMLQPLMRGVSYDNPSSTQPVTDGESIKGRQYIFCTKGRMIFVQTCPEDIFVVADGGSVIVSQKLRLYYYGDMPLHVLVTEIADFQEALTTYRQVFDSLYAGRLACVEDRLTSPMAERLKSMPITVSHEQWNKSVQIVEIHVFGQRTFEVGNIFGYFTLEKRDGKWMVINTDYYPSRQKE